MTETLLELRDRDPYAYYERLRERSPVVWDEGMQAWLVVGHPECVVVERREDWFAPGMGTLRGAAEITGARSILTMRGKPHDALHKQLSKWLTPARCQHFADDVIRPVGHRIVEHVAPRGHCELHHDVAELIPLGVVGELLGMPPLGRAQAAPAEDSASTGSSPGATTTASTTRSSSWRGRRRSSSTRSSAPRCARAARADGRSHLRALAGGGGGRARLDRA